MQSHIIFAHRALDGERWWLHIYHWLNTITAEQVATNAQHNERIVGWHAAQTTLSGFIVLESISLRTILIVFVSGQKFYHCID